LEAYKQFTTDTGIEYIQYYYQNREGREFYCTQPTLEACKTQRICWEQLLQSIGDKHGS
jgi:hypothetical protein